MSTRRQEKQQKRKSENLNVPHCVPWKITEITFSESRCRLRIVGGKSRTNRSSGRFRSIVSSISGEQIRPFPYSYTAMVSDLADLPKSKSDSDFASDSCHHHSRTGILTFIFERTVFAPHTTDLDLLALHTMISDKNLIDPGFVMT